MILSTNSDLGEFEAIRLAEHVEQVWKAIETELPRYWQGFIDREAARQPTSGASKLAAHFGGSTKASSTTGVATNAFAAAVQQYEKAAIKYREFFNPEAMDEFADDPNSFKLHLSKEVPIISGTLNQRRAELQKWQRDFRSARGKDLLEVFSNVLDFREDWTRSQPDAVYAAHDDPAAFALDPLDDDEGMTLTSVIGMGIKSVILYHLDARIFPQRTRSDLYGFYFLSGMRDFGLPSHSSEFLMVNDREPASNGSFIMEHNFWYPYGLFSLYASRLFRWLDHKVREAGGGLDKHVRHVFVACFLNSVCSEHTEHMKIMRAHDRFEVPA
jgi:hypothetical protein